MSDPNDRGSRPPRGPGSGVSGSAGSIGKALGGDLDFEPDLLLDALTDEEARPTRRPPDPLPEPAKPKTEQATMVDELELFEGDRPSFADDEVTVVGQRDFFESTPQKPGPPPVPVKPLPFQGFESTSPTPLVQPPKDPQVGQPSLPRPAAGGLRPPPTVPRPLASSPLSAKPQVTGVPRPGGPSTFGNSAGPRPPVLRRPSPPPTAPPPRSEMPTLSAATTAPPPGSTSFLTPAPGPAESDPAPAELPAALAKPAGSSLESAESPATAPPLSAEPPPAAGADSSAPPAGGSSAPPEGEARTSLTPEEIEALEELDQLDSLAPARKSAAPSAKSAWQAEQKSDRPRMSSAPPRLSDRPALPKPGQPDEWKTRAEWMEGEARRIQDPQARSRALVVASELWAIAGDMERARRAAQDGNTAGRAAVAGRQLRWIAAASGDWKTVASTLEIELRGSSTQEARAHAALLDAEVHRLCLGDEESAKKKIDLAVRAQPDDPRVHLENIVEALTAFAKPELELPETPDLGELSRALEQVRRLRGASSGSGSEKPSSDPLSAFSLARRAIARGDRLAAATALAEVGNVDGLKDAVAWLSAALLAHDAGTREASADHLRSLISGSDARPARRALAARALELGDPQSLLAALEPNDGVFTAADQLTLALLTGADAEAIEDLAESASDEGIAPLRAAALSAVGCSTPEAGAEVFRAEAALGRAIAGVNGQSAVAALAPTIDRFADSHSDHPAARLLPLELAIVNKNTAALAEAARGLPGRDASAETRDRSLARGLLLELAGSNEAAREAYAAAASADPEFEAALRARMPALDSEAASAALAALAESSGDSARSALLLVEAALKNGFRDSSKTDEWLKRSATLEPGLGIAFRLGEQDARSNADTERLVDWLRARREASSDDVERALDLVREALLSSDANPGAAAELLEVAISAHPGDVGLRELCERLRPGENLARGSWREAAAEHAGAQARVLLLLQAAFEYERAGDRAAAARTARRAAELGGGPLATLTAQRTAAGTPEAARVSEELLARARAAEEPALQRELYEELSTFDRGQGDSASALLWQSAILERSAEWLPALRNIEHAYVTASRDDELEPIAATLARVLPDGDGIAAARIAARSRLKAGQWAERRELAELALARDPDCLWALRALAAHARAADEPERALEAYQRLEELVVHPLDKAALNLRAAEAAARLGRLEDAKRLLDETLESAPDHFVALSTLAEVLEGLRDYAAAARAVESVAEASTVTAHQVATFHQAAMLWLDKVSDKERGRAALERTLSLDPLHEDAIVRLQTLLVEQGDHPALASLLERRIELATDPEERIALEVQRGKLLAGVGENQAARSALSAALDANPDHAGALEALADLCVAEGDWSAAEQAFIRLARHVPEQERQAQIYKKLGELYDANLPNPERAELAYLEVLKRTPDDADTVQRLVNVYGQRGDVERAVTLQSELLERATTPDQKRERTLALAAVYEQIVKDRKRADATFERARREWPQDTQVLRALVEYHRRAGEQRAAQMLLDRAANDARRALGTGRFDPSLFEVLGTVADLRGAADAALVAEATLAALAGQPFPVHGAGIAAADAGLDDLTAPELVTPALRTLLRRTGDVLDAAYALDARTLRAAALPNDGSGRADQVRDMAKAFGIQGIEVLVSPVLGPSCLAARSVPAQIVYGAPLLERGDDATRYFLLVRALKLIQARAATLARTVPIELGPLVAGFLSAISDYQPEGVDPKRLGDAKKRIKDAMIHPFDAEVPMLALEVTGSLGNRVSQLATALSAWANRTALLAVGNPLTALRAVALASGAELPADDAERLRWIARNPEARDLFVFSVSDQYIEARKRVGVQG
jgi:cellulose synthase operon protein C